MDVRKFRTKKLAWMAGIAVSAVALASTVTATPESPIVFGPKLTTDHQVRAVVSPSIRIDDEGRISLAWVEEALSLAREGVEAMRSLIAKACP